MTPSDSTPPMLSICCIAFNQKHYIKESIDSILMQRTKFSYEIIVHDDASTDGTAEIIAEYSQRYQSHIKPIFQIKNQYSSIGLRFQFLHLFPKIRGKYIAFCDGDDYWVDPLKIEKQIQFLEENPTYGMVYSRAITYIQAKMEYGETIGSESSSFEQLLHENTVPFVTACIRRDLFENYIDEAKPGEQKSWTTCDFPIWLWFAKRSKISFSPDILAAYRVTPTSISHNTDHAKRLLFHEGIFDIVKYYTALDGSTPQKVQNRIHARYLLINIPMYFLCHQWRKILSSLPLLWKAKEFGHFAFITALLPFQIIPIIPKAAFFIQRNLRSRLFSL